MQIENQIGSLVSQHNRNSPIQRTLALTVKVEPSAPNGRGTTRTSSAGQSQNSFVYHMVSGDLTITKNADCNVNAASVCLTGHLNKHSA